MLRSWVIGLAAVLLASCSSGSEPLRIPAASLGSLYEREKDGMIMVFIPSGVFHMGSAVGDPQTEEDEFPQHAVKLDNYWFDRTPVTNGMYALCVSEKACRAPRKSSSWRRSSYYENHRFSEYPVIYVDWKDARQYCRWAGAVLPTEAQWEYAASGPQDALFPWGNRPPESNLLNYAQPLGDTTPVDAYPGGISWVGALDMAGNVWEWTADWYGAYPDRAQENPTGPRRGQRRVLRGGSFLNGLEGVRTASRHSLLPGEAGDPFWGFRCAAPVASQP